MSNVKFVRPDYAAKVDNWKKVRLACSASGIKDAGVEYLSMALDKNEEKYEAYKKRALYLGVTGRTRSALVGAAFRTEPSFDGDLPETVEFINSDFDGAGQSINQIAKRMVNEVHTTGRHGLLVDFPIMPESASREDEQGIYPFIARYNAESIINWEETRINGKTQLSMVVLREVEDEPKAGDEFEREQVIRYRSLQLIDGVYTVRIWNEGGDQEGEAIQPKIKGQALNYIPFFFTGSEDNNSSIDEIPLEAIADINIGHYRNSADFEKNLYIHSGGTIVIASSIDGDEWNKSNPNGVVVGADTGIKLQQGDSAELLQLDPASAVDEAMKRKEEQMIAIGARLITSGNINETAEAARISASSETSVLSTIVGNVEETLNKALTIIGEAMKTDIPAYVMNREFFDSKLTAQEFMAINVMYGEGHLAQSDVRGILRKTGVIHSSRSDADIESEKGQASPV